MQQALLLKIICLNIEISKAWFQFPATDNKNIQLGYEKFGEKFILLYYIYNIHITVAKI